MKKVCFFISSISSTGGTERVCTEIANKLSELGYAVTILSMYGATPFFELKPAISTVAVFEKKRRFKFALPLVLFKLRREISKIAPDVLVNADSALFIYSWVAGLGVQFKNLVWEHFNFNVSLNTSVRVISRRLAAKYSSAIITLTQKDQGNWRANLNCKAPVYTINNPLPFDNATYDNTLQKPIVLSVGRLTHQKGFDRLINAWKHLKQLSNHEWQLHIVGSGELHDSLIAQIENLDLTQSVRLIPATPNIAEHYKQASIYCMASRFEGFGMVLIEAQAFGLPLVSYDCEAGPAEIIGPENGILVKDGDEQALVGALLLLMNNKDKRLQMGGSAFRNAKRYHIDVIVSKWKRLLESEL